MLTGKEPNCFLASKFKAEIATHENMTGRQATKCLLLVPISRTFPGHEDIQKYMVSVYYNKFSGGAEEGKAQRYK